ncbi:hypothetical protein ASG32_27265 [Methylobacterium sp. Leaf361]|nr:hypothetical protein ASG32_27265 [Methylobacterium sp. Leaf361]
MSAEDHWVPRILAGQLGRTAEEIERRVEAGHRLAEADVRAQGTTLSDVEFLFWRLASEARCREACADFIAHQAAAAKGIEALFLLMAGLKAAEEAQALVVKSALPRAHALAVPVSPARRPLRPEDFGALPGCPQSAAMPWADRVRRVAKHPGHGVGPIHGAGEPPQRPQR